MTSFAVTELYMVSYKILRLSNKWLFTVVTTTAVNLLVPMLYGRICIMVMSWWEVLTFSPVRIEMLGQHCVNVI